MEDTEIKKDDTLINRVHNKEFSSLKTDIEGIIATKVSNKIIAVKEKMFSEEPQAKE